MPPGDFIGSLSQGAHHSFLVNSGILTYPHPPKKQKALAGDNEQVGQQGSGLGVLGDRCL